VRSSRSEALAAGDVDDRVKAETDQSTDPTRRLAPSPKLASTVLE
jgi:hypothetical protein